MKKAPASAGVFFVVGCNCAFEPTATTVLTGAAPQPDEACLAGSVGGLRSGGDRVSKDRLWAALWRWLAAVSRPPDRSPL
jgi:hypothetical protein